MAIWNFLPCFDTGLTYTSAYIVDVGVSTVNPGEVYDLDGLGGEVACGIVDSINLTDPAYYNIGTQHLTCIDCYNFRGLNFNITNCDLRQSNNYTIDSNQFNFVPQLNRVNYYDLDDFGTPIQGCFLFLGPTTNLANVITINSISGQYDNCIECDGGVNTGVVRILTCATDDGYATYYFVNAPTPLPPINDLVSFSTFAYPLDTLCGIVDNIFVGPSDSTLITNYGQIDCDVCLEQNATKRIAVSCITGRIQVLYVSPLYNIGDVFTFSIIGNYYDSCYQVSGETTSAVTNPDIFVSYKPISSCEECISCNGTDMSFGLCSDLTISGYVRTYQYLEVGGTFFHPVSGCCQVIDYVDLGGTTPNDSFFSFYTFEDCPTCIANTLDYQSWFSAPCDGSVNAIATPGGYTPLSVYQTYLGSSILYECGTLLSELIYDPNYPWTFAITNEIQQTNCETCDNSLRVGLAVVRCGSSVVEYRSISISEYFIFLYTYEYYFRTTNGECYLLIPDSCPESGDYPPLSILETFTSCEECFSYVPPPVSAGTEYTDCQICCDCTTAETINSVVVPHPQWTSPQGTLITLLDAVQLGGTNGLNN